MLVGSVNEVIGGLTLELLTGARAQYGTSTRTRSLTLTQHNRMQILHSRLLMGYHSLNLTVYGTRVLNLLYEGQIFSKI